jgi:hypothetical protein
MCPYDDACENYARRSPKEKSGFAVPASDYAASFKILPASRSKPTRLLVCCISRA